MLITFWFIVGKMPFLLTCSCAWVTTLLLICTSSLVMLFIDEYLSTILGTLMKMHMVRNFLSLLLCMHVHTWIILSWNKNFWISCHVPVFPNKETPNVWLNFSVIFFSAFLNSKCYKYISLLGPYQCCKSVFATQRLSIKKICSMWPHCVTAAFPEMAHRLPVSSEQK